MSKASSVKVIFYNPIKDFEVGLQQGIDENLIKILAESKSLCPVGIYPKGSGQVGGMLRNSLMMRTPNFERGFNDSSGTKAENEITPMPKPLQGYIGSNLYYAVYRHYGTRKMGGFPFLSAAIAIHNYGQSAKIVREKLNFVLAHAKNFKETSRVKFY